LSSSWRRSAVLRRRAVGKRPISVEPLSCFLGKVIFEHRDRTSKWARDPKVLSGRDSTPVPNARKTRAVGAASGKSLYGWSDWWSNEDSNHGPGRFYRRRDRIGGLPRPGSSASPEHAIEARRQLLRRACRAFPRAVC
jgi:hypothetical protein